MKSRRSDPACPTVDEHRRSGRVDPESAVANLALHGLLGWQQAVLEDQPPSCVSPGRGGDGGEAALAHEGVQQEGEEVEEGGGRGGQPGQAGAEEGGEAVLGGGGVAHADNGHRGGGREEEQER